MIQILIVDDEKPICDLIDLNLSSAGYHCVSVQDGLRAIDMIEEKDFDLVLLDIMLPGADGYDVMDYIRPLGIPVIFITAKHEVRDRVKGLKSGADDYLVKPFDTQELLARLLAVLRRNGTVGGMGQAAGRLTFRDLVIEPDRHRVTVCGREVSLTRREYLILELFMSNPQKVFTKNNIYESVWNEEFVGEENAVNVHISNLRKKLAKAGGSQPYIQTVWGIGFKMKTL